MASISATMMPVSRLAPSGSVASVKARNAQPKTCLSSKVGVKAALKLGKVQQRAVVSQAAKTVKMTATGVDWAAEAAALDNASPLEIMDHALRSFPGEIGIAFSGAEDVALIHYAHMTGRPFRVFSLDTGRLNSETYYLFDAVEKRYGIRIEYTFPDQQEVMELVREKGLFSFYEDGHQECCRARKVRPLRRQLSTLDAWITGQRKDQSPGTRTEVPVVQVDPAFEGKSGGTGSLIKYNPLSNIIGTDVWAFLRAFDVPTNDLHQQGYVSIGCEPCTRAVLPGQQEREGRWWWEEAADKECGLHKGNIEGKEGGADAGPEEVTDLYTAPAIGKADIEALLTGARAQDTMVVVYAPWCQFCQGFEEQFNSLVAEGGPVKMVKFQGDGDMKEFCQTKLGLQSFPAIYMFPKHTGMVIPYPTDRRDSEFLKAFVRATATY